ncbi:tRNA dimethylallyltransferase [Erysipelothrix larvae]|uniref:tRNA dimethylallyltransferase n=1 Tax=Erysipelothrix larvae TaxID=1514105 RepID=A0A0X8GXW8_9FIRM|nr:tRNA (adenosine(37)-N6)-dimethylallyltransferase MiaA [Erysipelothrix larvae]AMC92451.1 tRNA dimethylallyltransferase [Erysipelothrix larvae]
MNKVYVIAGITASGKSNTAIQLAKKYNAEIISADSVAVYKEFNIGSAKPTLKEQQGIKHHLIDIRSYSESYDVAQFQKEARACIKEIQDRGKQVIVVGGTGLYLKALLFDYRFNDEPEIEIQVDEESDEALYQKLVTYDPHAAQKLHPNNRKRVVRALSAYVRTQKTQQERTDNQKDIQVIDADIYFLTGPREVMYERMDQRVEHMFESGLKEEVLALYQNDTEFFMHQSAQAIGYREFKEYFLGNQDLDQTKALIKRDTRRFAKRQWTWFRHQMDINTIDITEANPFEEIVNSSF